jgi:CheY-like chemotaxis protein
MASQPAGPFLLIVEDDPLGAASLADVLHHGGIASHVTATGEEALDFLRRGPAPSLILLDLLLPGIDGWEFLRRQRADPAIASIPVVVITGAPDAPEPPPEIEVAAYFTKPYDPLWLLETVRRYFGPDGGPS